MSLDIAVQQEWADGEYRFRLGVKELDELQDITGVGPAELFRRLHMHEWRRKDIRETIRLGLIGGGAEPVKANKLCKTYVDDVPLLDNRRLALDIVGAVLEGVKAATEGKTEAAKTDNDPMTTAQDGSTSPQPTETPSPSESLASGTASHSANSSRRSTDGTASTAGRKNRKQ